MTASRERVLMGLYFYPRGGSAHAARVVARELERQELAVTLLAGSRSDLGPEAAAPSFYAGLDVRAVDFTPALRSDEPLRYRGAPGTAPIHGSYEDRPGAADAVLAALDERAFDLQVDAWAAALEAAAADGVDVLYLHHLTPLNEAAARVLPTVPIVGHVHGTELLMLERIEEGPPPGWAHAEVWARRLRGWAGRCERIVVADPAGRRRAAPLLELPESRFACIPNGVEEAFSPGPVDRRALWRRILVEEPAGWAPGAAAGSVSYAAADLAALEGVVLLYVGRFTEVKRVPLLIEAFARARPGFRRQAALVLLGGHPGEWEGEHPLEAIARTGARDVFLAGWHAHEELPELLRGSDVLVHAAAREQFGQVLLEAMACGLPVVAVDRCGPGSIVDAPRTGWLVEPDDADALAAAMAAAVDDEPERRRRGKGARERVLAHYTWDRAGRQLAELLRGCPTSS